MSLNDPTSGPVTHHGGWVELDLRLLTDKRFDALKNLADLWGHCFRESDPVSGNQYRVAFCQLPKGHPGPHGQERALSRNEIGRGLTDV